MGLSFRKHLGSSAGFNSGGLSNRGGGGLNSILSKYGYTNAWSSENKTISGTTTTLLDYANEHNLANPDATSQPALNTTDSDFNNKPSFSFDEIADHFYKSVSNWRGSDQQGEIISVFKPNGASGIMLASSDEAANDDFISHGTNALTTRIERISVGGTLRFITTNPLEDWTTYGSSVWAWRSNGSSFGLNVNGTEKTVNVTVGADDGTWFGDISNRDNITIGARIKATNNFGNGKWCLTIYFATPLSSGNRTALINELKAYYGI